MKFLIRFIFKLFRYFLFKLYRAGLFAPIFITEAMRSDLSDLKITRGDDCSIEPSAKIMAIGEGRINFKGENYIGNYAEIATNTLLTVGRGTTIQDRVILLGEVEVGDHCIFAPNVFISSDIHQFKFKSHFNIRDQDILIKKSNEYVSQKVIIENDVWLGINSVISAGVRLGKGCVIGANSVVTKDVEPYAVMGGVPAKQIGQRYPFVAQSLLRYDIDLDIPYFYSGFFVDLKNLEVDRISGGISAEANFTLYLKCSGKLKLRIKKLVKEAISLEYNQQAIEIPFDDFIDIVFDSHSELMHRFKCKQNILGKIFLIEQVGGVN